MGMGRVNRLILIANFTFLVKDRIRPPRRCKTARVNKQNDIPKASSNQTPLSNFNQKPLNTKVDEYSFLKFFSPSSKEEKMA